MGHRPVRDLYRGDCGDMGVTRYSDVCEAKTKKEMIRLFKKLLCEVSKKYGDTPSAHREQQLDNVGYIAGYYDAKTAQKVYRWLNTEHPLFGKR